MMNSDDFEPLEDPASSGRPGSPEDSGDSGRDHSADDAADDSGPSPEDLDLEDLGEELGAGLEDDLGDDLEDDDDDLDEEDESDDDDPEADARKAAAEKKTAKKAPAKKSAKKGTVDDTGDARDAPPPVPKVAKMREAMAWAFEKEDMVTPELLDRFVEHALFLLEENQKLNLTALTDPREVCAKHYLDSWRLSMWMPLMGRRVLDLGSGAGFPGIPLALAEPHAKFSIVESIQKKADFIARSIEHLGLKNATAYPERAEEHLITNKVDIVLVRAVSSVRENVRLVRKVRHSLKDMVMFKGPSWSREVRAGEREAERLGFRLGTVWEYELPGDMGKRAILVYQAPGGQGR